MYSLNEITECKISPENVYIASATIKNCRSDLSKTMCSVKEHVFRYNCAMFLLTSYVHDQNSMIFDIIVTPEMCRPASKSEK